MTTMLLKKKASPKPVKAKNSRTMIYFKKQTHWSQSKSQKSQKISRNLHRRKRKRKEERYRRCLLGERRSSSLRVAKWTILLLLLFQKPLLRMYLKLLSISKLYYQAIVKARKNNPRKKKKKKKRRSKLRLSVMCQS